VALRSLQVDEALNVRELTAADLDVIDADGGYLAAY
jgi:hypothetical protein